MRKYILKNTILNGKSTIKRSGVYTKRTDKRSFLQSFFVEHIGSTSIPGMTAKPIIDILIGVYNFPPDKQFIDNLTRLGYTFMENASVPKRLYLIKRTKILLSMFI